MQYAEGCIDEQMGMLLAGYEFGRLSGTEREQFEAHMQACRACADEIAAMAHIHASLRAHRDVFEHPERYSQERRSWFAAFHWQPALGVAAALMLLVLLGVGYFRQPGVGQLAGLIVVEEDASGAQFRNGGEDLAAGLRAYRARDYATAIARLGAVDPKQASYYVAQYFLGLCYLKPFDTTDKIDSTTLTRALEAFGRAAQAAQGRDRRYEGQARLAAAKAYLLAGEREKARQELSRVEGLSGPAEEVGPLKETARALKAKL